MIPFTAIYNSGNLSLSDLGWLRFRCGAQTRILSAIFATLLGAAGTFAQEAFSPDAPPRPKVLLDYYHRTQKNTKIGAHLTTASYTATTGRYRPDDFSHTNSYDSLLNALEKEFVLVINESAFTPETLRDADIATLITPENPELFPHVPTLSNDEISALREFVERGGSLLVMLNAAEPFESKQLRKLLHGYGLDWNDDDTHYSDIHVGSRHPYFYDIDVCHYGSGCTLKVLPSAQSPEVLLNVYEDRSFPEVRGPGMVLVRSGAGKVLLVGDTGSWGGGNMSRPWAENRRLLLQMIRYLKRDQDVPEPTYTKGQTVRYDVRLSQLNVIPTGNPLAATSQPGFRPYTPRPRTSIPYSETEGVIDLVCHDIAADRVLHFSANLREWKKFDEPVPLTAPETIVFETTRQGSVISVQPTGEIARWVAPHAGDLVGFVPNDGIRVGDRWSKIEQIRINPVRGSEPASTKPVELEMVYVRDEKLAGHDCRVIRSQTEVWLSEIGVDVSDILPVEYVRHYAAPQFELMAKRGGRILFKREQWLDRHTGIVVKSHTQSRLLAWLHRIGEPLKVTTIEKDDRMVVSLADLVTFTIKE